MREDSETVRGLGDELGVQKTKQIVKQSNYYHQSNYSVKNIFHNQ